ELQQAVNDLLEAELTAFLGYDPYARDGWNTGNYLRYNDPHKLSLYLASGIPVIIWKKAAEAKFVEENKVGITVDSLEELPEIFKSLDATQYELFAQNVEKIAKKLVNGQYTIDAINMAYQRLSKE
ncbi:hypothetical protein EFM10_09625, partial [Lactobacillus helveticus]|nr:hypothetical protein [Lactobacillus helveticus]